MKKLLGATLLGTALLLGACGGNDESVGQEEVGTEVVQEDMSTKDFFKTVDVNADFEESVVDATVAYTELLVSNAGSLNSTEGKKLTAELVANWEKVELFYASAIDTEPSEVEGYVEQRSLVAFHYKEFVKKTMEGLETQNVELYSEGLEHSAEAQKALEAANQIRF